MKFENFRHMFEISFFTNYKIPNCSTFYYHRECVLKRQNITILCLYYSTNVCVFAVGCWGIKSYCIIVPIVWVKYWFCLQSYVMRSEKNVFWRILEKQISNIWHALTLIEFYVPFLGCFESLCIYLRNYKILNLFNPSASMDFI